MVRSYDVPIFLSTDIKWGHRSLAPIFYQDPFRSGDMRANVRANRRAGFRRVRLSAWLDVTLFHAIVLTHTYAGRSRSMSDRAPLLCAPALDAISKEARVGFVCHRQRLAILCKKKVPRAPRGPRRLPRAVSTSRPPLLCSSGRPLLPARGHLKTSRCATCASGEEC